MNKVISQDEWRVLWRKWNTVIWRKPSRISRLSRNHGTELRLQDASQTLELLKPGRLRFPLFSLPCPQGWIPSVRTTFVFSPETVPVQSKRYHLSLSAKSHSSATQSREDRFPEEKEEDMECCGWLRDARYWEFLSSCLEIQRGAFECCAEFPVWLYLGSILKKFYQLVGFYIWYKNVSVICPPQVSWVRGKNTAHVSGSTRAKLHCGISALQSYHCIVEDQPLSSTSPGNIMAKLQNTMECIHEWREVCFFGHGLWLAGLSSQNIERGLQ